MAKVITMTKLGHFCKNVIVLYLLDLSNEVKALVLALIFFDKFTEMPIFTSVKANRSLQTLVCYTSLLLLTS